MVKLESINHIAIVCENLDETVAFYENQLGIKCKHFEELSDRGIKTAMFPLGQIRIELIAPTRENSEVSSFLQKKGPGIHHIAFDSANVESDVKKLKANGVRLTSDDVSDGAGNTRVAFIHPKASGGVLLELVEPKK